MALLAHQGMLTPSVLLLPHAVNMACSCTSSATELSICPVTQRIQHHDRMGSCRGLETSNNGQPVARMMFMAPKLMQTICLFLSTGNLWWFSSQWPTVVSLPCPFTTRHRLLLPTYGRFATGIRQV